LGEEYKPEQFQNYVFLRQELVANFHKDMKDFFCKLRDLHTVYSTPNKFSAVLPFYVVPVYSNSVWNYVIQQFPWSPDSVKNAHGYKIILWNNVRSCSFKVIFKD
jgi:hypothetical protein